MRILDELISKSIEGPLTYTKGRLNSSVKVGVQKRVDLHYSLALFVPTLLLRGLLYPLSYILEG